jgi:hypothetical protein
VIVQRQPGATLSADEVREIAAHSVVGVGKDDVFVSIGDAPRFKDAVGLGKQASDSDLVPFLLVWQVPRDHYNSLAGAFVVLMVIVSALAGLGGYIIGQFAGIRTDAKGIGGNTSTLTTGSRASNRVGPTDEEEG